MVVHPANVDWYSSSKLASGEKPDCTNRKMTCPFSERMLYSTAIGAAVRRHLPGSQTSIFASPSQPAPHESQIEPPWPGTTRASGAYHLVISGASVKAFQSCSGVVLMGTSNFMLAPFLCRLMDKLSGERGRVGFLARWSCTSEPAAPPSRSTLRQTRDGPRDLRNECRFRGSRSPASCQPCPPGRSEMTAHEWHRRRRKEGKAGRSGPAGRRAARPIGQGPPG